MTIGAVFAYMLLLLYIFCGSASALPGNKPSRSRERSSTGDLTRAMPASRVVRYRLHESLLTPALPAARYQAYLDSVPDSLNRIGIFGTQIAPTAVSPSNLQALQGFVRDQMASSPQKRQFIPILHDPYMYGHGQPTKVYAMPLVGSMYRRFGVENYAGNGERQKLAILGTVLAPTSRIGPPVVELYGLADLYGAPNLHTRLPTIAPHTGKVHALKEFLDLDEVAPATPVVPRRVEAQIERIPSVHL